MKDSIFWNITVPRAMSIYANVIFVILWIGLILALVMNREWLDVLWKWVQALPLIPRLLIWLVFLPVMTALWIWESDWSTFARLLGFGGILAWTLVAISSLFRTFR